MSTLINSNSTAYGASLALNANTNSLGHVINQLSTGLKINNSADSPAGMVISQHMSDQISGIQQATTNTSNAINVTATADSALSQVQSLLTSIRQLAVQASNLGTNDTEAIAADQQQINSAISSINRISATTQYGSKNLLDGSASSATLTAASTASVTGNGNGVSIIAQGAWTTSMIDGTSATYTNVSQSVPTSTTDYSGYDGVLTSTFGGSLSINGTNYNLAGNSNSLANLNTTIASSGYQATVIGGDTLELKSTATGLPATTQTFNTTGLTNVGGGSQFMPDNTTQGANAEMTISGGTGTSLSSSSSVANGSGGYTYTFGNGMVVSTSSQANGMLSGTNINVTAPGTTTAGSTSFTGPGIGSVVTPGNWTSATAAVYNQNTINAATPEYAWSDDAYNLAGDFHGSITINSVQYNVGAGSSFAQLNSDIQASGYYAADTPPNGALTLIALTPGKVSTPPTFSINLTGNTVADGSGTTKSITDMYFGPMGGADASLTLSDGAGHSMTSVGSAADGGLGTAYTFANGLVVTSTQSAGAITGSITGLAGVTTATTKQGQDLNFQLGANQGQTASLCIGSTAANQLGTSAAGTNYTDANGASQTVLTDSLADINVTTLKGAQDALAVIDAAQSQVSTLRANIGSFQTDVLQANASSLGEAQQYLQSSQSTITDANLASTVVTYTKESILVQSATSALGYANQMPQYLLKLLQ